MTRSRYRIFETEYPYFMTSTIVGWLPLFISPDMVEVVFDSWRYLQKERQFQIFAYVILENHLHIIAKSPELSKDVQNFKSFTARKIVDLLRDRSAQRTLRQFAALKLRHKQDSEYQVWQEGAHPEQIQNDEMMLQKLEYIHNNPLRRGYVDDPVAWRYSSARNYARLGGLIDVVTDWI